MQRFSRARGESQEPERNETPSLSARSLSLLFPPRESNDRANKSTGDSTATSNKPIQPSYDQDDTKTFPLSPDEEPRIIIAQDDTGVSIDRLLYDSQWSYKSKGNTDKTNGEAKIFSFRPSTSNPQPTSNSNSNSSSNSSGFLRPQPSRTHRSTISVAPECTGSSRPLASAFVPSKQFRRVPAPVSLADAQNEPDIPVENTTEEMDSWLDCMFGKAPMQYKGAVTKIHRLQRQQPDPLRQHCQKESQCGGFAFCPEKNGSLPRSKPEDMVKLRKNALLISATFAVNVHDEDLPEQLQQVGSVHGARRMSSARKKRFGTPMFGVALLLPLVKPHVHNSTKHSALQEQLEDESDPIQTVLDNWHVYARALDALKTIASVHIQQRLRTKAEASARAQSAMSPAIPRLIKLEPRAFEHTPQIVQVSAAAVDRISRTSMVLKAEPQRDWSIWRDELRIYTRVAQDNDSKKGMFNLGKVNFIQASLTAALSVDLSWLNIFAPPHHQTRLREERRQSQSSFDSAQNRTVVVAVDQNMARNLIFIFAKLFPCPQTTVEFARSRRSSQNSLTSPSSRRVSAITQGLEAAKHSPKDGQANGNANGNGYINSYSTIHGQPTPTIFEPPPQSLSTTSPTKKSASEPTRKLSVAKGSGTISIPGKATPAVPISAPVSNRTTPSGSPEARLSSSANAHGELMRHLQRSGSTTTSNASTDTASIWNSFRSSTWSLKPRRESSITERSDSIGSNSQRDQQPTGILKTSKSFAARQNGSKLVRMVEEVNSLEPEDVSGNDAARRNRESRTSTSNGISHRTSALQFDPPNANHSGISYTYNQDEGVVDVDLPGFSSSPNANRNSAIRSSRFKVPSGKRQFPTHEPTRHDPTKSQTVQSPEGFASYDRIAGYLERFHPDFALQATKPYVQLIDEIKEAMRAEPSPMVEPSENLKVFSQETWIDVCSTVILDAEALTVKRLTFRRRVRYKLIVPDKLPSLPRHVAPLHGREHLVASDTSGNVSETENQIKVTKSEDMDSIKRTYKRNDQGQRVAFRDKKVLKTNLPHGDMLNGEQHSIDVLGTGLSHSPDSVDSRTSIATAPQANGARVDSPLQPKDQEPLLEKRPNTIAVGDDISEFFDRKSGGLPRRTAVTTTTKRVSIRNKEGKITGWKDVQSDAPEEAGLHDLPTGFVEKRRDKAIPIVECQTLAEKFEEEVISKPDSAVVNLLQQMLATSETRSRAHSRANSIHSRVPSRSNSISASGLSELQYESKKIIEDALEGLVSAVAHEKYTSTTASSGGLFSFARGTSTPEASILRQSISKWMHGDA